jgi:exodeoxyribonuclease V gamma subunit
MPGISLHTSNRLEILADTFSEIISNTPLPFFQKETILVQSKGMARWLALETASRLNIWANCDCPFPNSFIRKVFQQVLTDIPNNYSYEKELICWHLMDLLPGMLHEPGFQPVKSYLDTGGELSLYQLSFEIADLFDQYTLYRPDMILSWESGTDTATKDHSWQPQLWRKLLERFHESSQLPEPHRARLLEIFQTTIAESGFKPESLPDRVSVFGISSLPPYHLQVLAALAEHIDIYFFIINPCQEYWADIIIDRQIVKISKQEKISEEILHLEQGNSLLASMGKLGRDMISLIQDFNCNEHEYFDDPGQETLLKSIQQDILYLREHSPAFTKNETQDASHHKNSKLSVSDEDTSIVFHVCHSPMREVEILRDYLLGFFSDQRDKNNIQPKDILVMTPDIEKYGPLVQAAFNSSNSSIPRIPYTISDRNFRSTSNYFDAFFKILTLPESRLTNVQVLSLLESDLIKQRFEINDYDLPIIKKWIEDTGICWGIDQYHRQDMMLPAMTENTWRSGLDSLLLGYAMPGRKQNLFNNILPYDHLEGHNTVLLGNFLDFAETLFNQVRILEQRHTLHNWSGILLNLLDDFFPVDNSAATEINLLRQIFHDLKEKQVRTTFEKPVGIDVIRTFLGNKIDQTGLDLFGSANFLTGGVTFCEMLPMRAVPFKVICLLGMNDNSYPRPGRTKSFDLMNRQPRRGDRSRRIDDRFLFLEALLSARNQLYISYIGHSVTDDTKRPPSVLVSELLDYIEQSYEIRYTAGETCQDIIEHLTTRHRLQPFHPDYFKAPDGPNFVGLFSFSYENYEAATSLAAKEKNAAFQTIGQPLPPPSDTFKEIDILQLSNFFDHPTRFFLTRRLGIAPIEQLQQLDTSEPFDISGLQRYNLENELLQRKIRGLDLNEYLPVKKATGDIPHGKIGYTLYGEMVSEINEFNRKIESLSRGTQHKQVEIDLLINHFRIHGRLEHIGEHGMIMYRCAKINSKDMIKAWLSHLALNMIPAVPLTNFKNTTFLVGKDKIYQYAPTLESQNHLQQLLTYYWQGLSKPLHFFPHSSYTYARETFKGNDQKIALYKARSAWEGSDYRPGEKDNPYYRLCFKDTDPFDQQFIDLAEYIFLPLLGQQQDYKV